MKLIKKILEYRELAYAGAFVALFFVMQSKADPITAGASADWLFRLPILAAVAMLLPALTDWVWRRTFISLASLKTRDIAAKKYTYYTYAATMLAIAILAHALI